MYQSRWTDCGLALNVFMDEITRLSVLGDSHRQAVKHHPYFFWLLTLASNM
tara:strand:- start:609 stop:761 length:153 start_codon:yes stop_codon:yes gene_type:complete